MSRGILIQHNRNVQPPDIAPSASRSRYDSQLWSGTFKGLIWTPHRLNSGKIASLGHDDHGFQYKIGFGWFISDEPGNLIVHHGGGLDGNASYIDRYVDKKLTIIILINREPTLKARAIARKVASTYSEVRNLGISE